MEHTIGDPVTGAVCASCRFWVRQKPRPDLPGWHANGNCHRHPATLLKHGEDWCGDHELRPDLEPLGERAASVRVAAAA